MIATSCVDNMVKINTMFCSDDSILSEGYRHHQAPVLSIDFHPTYPQLMLTTSMDGSSALVDISCENDTSDHPQVLQRFNDHERYVVRGVFSSHRYFATASYDHTVIVYQSKFEDIANQLPEYTLLKQFRFTGNVETICFYDDEILIVGVRNDSYLHYIRLSDMVVTRIDMKSSDWASSTFSPTWISVSPDGRHLLCTTDHASGLVILFALGEQRQVQNYYIHPTENGITTKRHLWHRSGLYFYALGGDDNSVAVVETKTGRVIHSLTGHQAMIRSMAMSDIGLVTAGYDHTIKIWSKPTLDR
jgi:WD40 repeat protein